MYRNLLASATVQVSNFGVKTNCSDDYLDDSNNKLGMNLMDTVFIHTLVTAVLI